MSKMVVAEQMMRTGPPPNVKLVIPSRGRADIVTTHKYWANTILCVGESEVPAYREQYPDIEIVPHPDHIVGFPTFQWIYEHFGDVLFLSDDLGPLFWQGFGQGDTIEKMDAQTCYDVVQHVARVAWEMGAHMFSLSASHDVRNFVPQMPFRMSGYVQGKVGLFKGSKLYFPDDPYNPYGDYFISGLNAYYHRYLWIDNRFGCEETQPDMTGKGGASEWRNISHFERWKDQLER